MNTYPSYPPIVVGSSRTLRNPTHRSSSDGGYTITRKKWTKPKSSYSLNYPALNAEQFKILRDFFIANQGQAFKFRYPLEDEIKICVFAMDDLKADDNMQNHCAVKVEIVEI